MNDEEFARRAGAMLREGAERLDDTTRRRLTQARAAAVERAQRPAWFRLLHVAPVGVAASLIVAMLLLWPREPATELTPLLPGGSVQDLELLADAEAWALTEEEDFAFLEWAAAVAELEAGSGG
jgi:hypothetical protein